ncbi:hypothetical protein K9M78_04235 [Candidatus Bipolaricaulota bacterium]|nr:hypothetical protein [Candidatus Bipolaricaulota bacterium]
MMFQGYEIVTLLLGLIATAVILLNRKMLQTLPAVKFLIAGFSMFLASWFLTNIETLLLRDIFNLLEHLSQASGGILLTIWCWEVFRKAEEG